MSEANKGEKNPMLGKNHSEESEESKKKTKMSEAKIGKIGKKHSDESRKKISDANKGENHPMHGKPRPEGAGKSLQAIEVFDLEEKTIITYDSISAATRALNSY
jgi:hypothetical protein